jgi:2-isopropylmalate synthase
MSESKFATKTDKYWVTEHNFFDEVRSEFTLPKEVKIHDVTLREAEQAPHIVLRPDEKIRIYEALDELGVYSVEVFPIISEEDKELAKELVKRRRKAKIVFLCRWHKEEVDFALECGADGVVVEGAGNTRLAEAAIGATPDEMYKHFVETTRHAKDNGLFTSVMPWDSNRGPFSFMERIYKGVVNEGGADNVVIADSHGCSLPGAVSYFVRKIKEWVPGTPVEMHAHNDMGLATACMLSAVTAGASVVHTSINCLGERAGNAATEEVALDIELLLGLKTGIRLDRLYPVAQMVAEMTKIPIARNKAIVGDNEFTAESGMVVYMQDHMTANNVPFMAYLPELIGRKGRDIVLGKMTGAYAVDKKLKELGINASKEQVKEITRRVKMESSLRKWSITQNDLDVIASDVIGKASAVSAK